MLAAGTGDLFAFCNSSIETYAIFQCGQRGYFAPVPAPHSPASVTGVFWQIGFGNASVNTGLGSDGTGFASKAFNGNDSGTLPVNFLDAAAVFPAEGFPAGSICLGSNNWANSGVDGCCDNPRLAGPFPYTNAYSGLGPYDYAGDDDILNPYFGTYQARNGYLGYYSLASMMDYPVAILARTPGDTFFAIAAVTNMSRGNNGVTTLSDCASGIPANPATCDTQQGEWLFGNVSNGAPNAIPSEAGRNNVISWQQTPIPDVSSNTPVDPNDPNGPVIMAMSWQPVTFHHDGRSVPTNNPTLDARNPSQPGDPNAAPGVGVPDLIGRFGIVRYQVQVAGETDVLFNTLSQVVTCPGDPECPTATSATLTLGSSECVRIRTVFGIPSRTPALSVADCRLARCGDIGYGVNGARVCVSTCDPDPGGETCNGLDDDCDGSVDEVVFECGIGECLRSGSCVDGAPSCDPGLPSAEACDALDNDCDGTTDEDFVFGQACDGAGTCGMGVTECGPGSGLLICSTEPGGSADQSAAELCDALDNDCDGATDESNAFGQACDGEGECGTGTTECPSGAGTICSTEPGGSGDQSSAELCDALDNDCDGATDDGLVPSPTTCGVGACESTGEMVCFDGAFADTCTPGAPSTEICDNIDNNCDGAPDNLGTTCGIGGCRRFADCDGGVETCTPGPPTAEICDNFDNDCDGTIDGFATTCGVGQCTRSGSCTAGGNTCAPGVPSAEICNDNLDNDCDGSTDELSTTCGIGSCMRSGSCLGGVGACTPGAPSTEICDNLDNDCDGGTDELSTTCGVGACMRSGSCVGGVGSCTPGAPSAEICDNLDNDCDGTTDEGIVPSPPTCGVGACMRSGSCEGGVETCTPGAPSAENCDNLDNDCDGTTDAFATQCGLGTCARTGSCTFGSNSCQPGQPTAETCDALDNDCDGATDEGIVPSPTTCGVGSCQSSGGLVCTGGMLVDTCTPGAPSQEICDGLDNDCDSVLPGGEFDLDFDGAMICEGDCDDGDGAIFPGAAEICDGRNNDCNHPAWPSLEVEDDDDSDGLAECAGDCDDLDPSRRPGAPETCDLVDNDCDGRIDPGIPFLIQGNPLPTVTLPGGALSDRFGSGILSMADVDLDGTPDFAVGSTGSPAGTSTLGAIHILSGDDRTSIRVLTDPDGTTPAELGYALASPGDVDADGVPEVAGSAPAQTVQIPAFEQGRVILFSGATGSVLWSHQKHFAASQARLGTSLASIADLNGNGSREIVAGMIIGCRSGPDCGGTATILDGLSGVTLRTLGDSGGLPGDRFGASMASLGDQDADGDDELAIGSPSKAVFGTGGAGEVRIYSTGNGVLLRVVFDPMADPNDGFGEAVAAIADLNGDGKLDLLAGSPGRDTAAGADAGQVLVFSGATGALLMRLEDPGAVAGDGFGSAVAAIPDLNGDATAEIAVGARNADTAAGADAGKVVVFSGIDGAYRATLEHPIPEVGDHFGASVAAVGPVDGDGRFEIAAGAPDDNGAANDTGSLVLFSPSSIGDCDGDSIGDPVDTCTDADHDGYGTDIFVQQTCPLDCDDSNGDTFPGGVQVCDGANNDCNDPSYPAVPSSECFAVSDLTAQRAGANLLLQWAVPSGGADSYRVYRALSADLPAGASGGFCFATSVPPSIQLSDPVPPGNITYYVIAGVRGSLEGSRGSMLPAQERPRGDICP